MGSAAFLRRRPGMDQGALSALVLESLGDGVIVESDSGVYLNAEARRLLAVPEGCEPALSEIPAQRRNGDPLPYEEWPSVAARRFRTTIPFTTRLQRFDGVDCMMAGTAAPLLQDGEVVGVTLLFRDVTDEAAAAHVTEELLRRVFDLVPTAVSVMDLETGRIIDCNQAFAELTGLERPEILAQSQPFSWWDDTAAAAFEATRDDERCSALFRDEAGRPVPVDILRSTIPNPHGRGGVRVALVTNLSDRRSIELQLLQSAKLASIGELAAGVAHEINNPLFAIMGLAEFLEDEVEPGSKARERVRLIVQTAGEIKAIVRALLDFARERTDELVDIYVRDALTQTLDLIRRTSANRSVEIVETYSDEAAVVKASPNQLKQVFLNLVTNARQAMPDGGRIAVTLAVEADSVVVHVSDTGAGIPEDVLPRIFEPFFTTKQNDGGTGLGLSVTHGIVEAHGGTLSVHSSVGVGTTFTVRLPRSDTPA